LRVSSLVPDFALRFAISPSDAPLPWLITVVRSQLVVAPGLGKANREMFS
jgi:hypothetical protein